MNAGLNYPYDNDRGYLLLEIIFPLLSLVKKKCYISKQIGYFFVLKILILTTHEHFKSDIT
jgi:hypothetical protein